MKSLLIVVLLLVTVYAHNEHPNNKPVPPPMHDVVGKSDPASICLTKNTTDARLLCLINVVGKMQLEMAEQRGEVNAAKFNGAKRCKIIGIGASILVSLLVIGGIVRCCCRCRRGCKRYQCGGQPIQTTTNAGVVYANVPVNEVYPAQMYSAPQTTNNVI